LIVRYGKGWIVRYSKGEGVKAQAHSCDIKADEDVYDWIAIDESFPVSEPQDYDNAGLLVDFNFEKCLTRNLANMNMGYNKPLEALIKDL
jgi:uncharacterized protein YukJ